MGQDLGDKKYGVRGMGYLNYDKIENVEDLKVKSGEPRSVI